MNHLSVPFLELVRVGFLDVFSTIVLFWALAAVLVRTEKVSRSVAALALALAGAVTIDALTGGWWIWKRPAIAVVGIIHVAVIQTVRLGWRKVRFDPDDTVPEVSLTAAGLLVLAISIAGAAYCVIRDIPEASGYFGRLCFGYLFTLLFFGFTARPSLVRRRTLAVVLTCILGVTVAIRAGAWVWFLQHPDGPLAARVLGEPEPGTPFPRLATLLEVRRALAETDGNMPAAVEDLRRAAGIANPEWWERSLPGWAGGGEMRESLDFPLALAFGTSVSLERDEEAVAFGLDEAGFRFLVVTDRGRLVSSGRRKGSVVTVDFEPADMCVSASGAVVILGEDGALMRADPSGGLERSDLPAGEYRGVACAGETVFAVRADGSVVRSAGGVTEETFGAFRPGSDEAVDIAVVMTGHRRLKLQQALQNLPSEVSGGIYILDGHGGIHPRGDTPIREEDLAGHEDTIHYWPHTRPAAGIVVTADGFPVYADAYGGVHAVIRDAQGVRHTGNRFPRLSEPLVVDLLLEARYSAVYLLTRQGDILAVPQHGWLTAPSAREDQ